MTTRLSIVAIALLTTAACAERNEFAVFEFEVMDGEVVCDSTGEDATCRSPHPREQLKREYIRTPGSIALAGPASNSLWWLELAARREGNTRARMTLAGAGGKFMEARHSTREFDSRQVSGTVLLPENEHCPCQAGRFELSFRAPGLDGVVGTADDERRRLSRGRIRTDGRPFCQKRAVLPIVEGQLTVKRVACPVDPAGFAPNGSNGTTTSTPAPGNNTGWSLGFDDHPECVFFGWDDEDQWVWTGDSSDWDAQEAQDEGWYDDDWASSDDGGEGWSDSWDDSFGDSGSGSGGWSSGSGSGSSSGGSGSDSSWDDWGSDDDDGWDDWGSSDDDGWDSWGGDDSGDDGWDWSDDSSDWGDDSSDDDYWDDDDGW